MAKQSLYALLGLTDKASPEDIQRAYQVRCEALATMTAGDDKRNQMSFLLHARDTLLDRKKRALYDRELWTRVEPSPASPPRNRAWLWFAVIGVGVVLVWRNWLPINAPPTSVPGGLVAATTAPRPADLPQNLPKLADIERIVQLVPEFVDEPPNDLPAEPPPAPTVRAAPPLVKPEPLPVQFMVRNTAVFDKIIGSTFAIVGTQGMGTGVMIDKDKLLTNCHVLAPNILKGKIYAISAVTRERFEITEAAFLVKDDACVALAPGLNGQAIPIGDTRTVRPGTHFHNLGFAEGKLTLADGRYLGSIVRSQQTYMVSTNFCAPGVSGGALVNDDGQLMGLTSGGPPDRSVCLSLTAETARSVLSQTLMQIDAFPTNYLTNFKRRW